MKAAISDCGALMGSIVMEDHFLVLQTLPKRVHHLQVGFSVSLSGLGVDIRRSNKKERCNIEGLAGEKLNKETVECSQKILIYKGAEDH